MIQPSMLLLLAHPTLLQADAAAPTSETPAPATAPTAQTTAPAGDKSDAAAIGTGGKSDGSDAAKTGDKPTPGTDGGSMILYVFIGMIVLMFVFSGRSKKKQAKKFQSLYDNLKRDDQIMLQNGKFVVVDTVEKDRITVFADKARQIREVYHRNAVANMAAEVFPDASAEGMKRDG